MESFEEQLRHVRQRISRPASVAKLGGRPTGPSGSYMGDVRMALPGETWPQFEGKPMRPICQINCLELPHRPASISDIAFITLFMRWGDDGYFKSFDGEVPPNGREWALRAYPHLDGLVELARPTSLSLPRPALIQWELLPDDVPTWDDPSPAGSIGDLGSAEGFKYHDHFKNTHRTKVGGWPSNIQSAIFWAPRKQHPSDPEYVFQIDSEEKVKLAWGDSGTAYFGRGRKDPSVWAFEWQCY